MLRPLASRARARTRTSKADSTPMLFIRSASFMGITLSGKRGHPPSEERGLHPVPLRPHGRRSLRGLPLYEQSRGPWQSRRLRGLRSPSGTARPWQTPRVRSRSQFQCRRCQSSYFSQNADYTRRAGATQILGESERMTRNLAFAGLASDLQNQIADLSYSRRAHRVAFRFQTTAGVDGALAGACSVTFERIWSALPARSKAEIFAGDNLGDREAVVQLRKLDVAWRHTCHRIGLLGGAADCGKRGDVGFLVQRDIVGGLGDSENTHRLIGELAGPIVWCQDDGRRSVADQRAVVEIQRIGNGLAIHCLFQRDYLPHLGVGIQRTVGVVLHRDRREVLFLRAEFIHVPSRDHGEE